MKIRACALALMLVCTGHAFPAAAAVTLQGTRVIYDGSKGAVTVNTNNRGDKVALAQVWLDDGDASAKAGSQKLPFVLTPTTRRIEAGGAQAFRLTYAPMAGAALPSDRESLLYFNLLDIPPKPENVEGQNLLQFAIRTRVKLFYRPAGLPGHARDTAAALQWRAEGQALQVYNPGFYHVTLSRLTLPDGSTIEVDMVAPGERLDLPLPSGASVPGTLEFQWLDDYGTTRDAQAKVIH
ncbi:fimbria/pilus periplasmic chaperone [Stenotrophomonas maltophilia]|uniref:fimbrial biogenesis chaperone n=1 Tax=Stenotrophomonas TaxID=40323 RepID=UPI0006C3A610|nr:MULTISPECIES: fimbria/pilus periplasmic chaperone [Stenotrophomonas]KAA3598244.1 molecular chaperone [Stenotrophomonas maltophilia]KOO77672.1 molecular chaperone [Stenotrophomonas maltophilia]MBN5127116.1 fimbria/pilus periplasmic chaperone [Stenotrophomonas maltophilia]MBN5178112.1 fimbria/pilus periplasmic chaperone [Stenotrophomonas maltophilia]MCU1121615.1 fimbria/pilus periplasmic chaperone [Stenotrophomonas maltophilia]